MIEKHRINRDDTIYEAFPDVALTNSGKLVCVFAECTHHSDRSYTRIMQTTSQDRGRTWTAKTAITEGTAGLDYYYNCARISRLRSGSLALAVDRIRRADAPRQASDCENLLYFSDDEGATWSQTTRLPAQGIVPDKLLELADGRWIYSCHHEDAELGYLVQRLWYSDDQGTSWSDPVIVGRQEGLHLCEASLVPLDNDTLVAFMRENSMQGWDCYKTLSFDRGESWSEPIRFPLPGCHRPVAGFLQSGELLITHRFIQGGQGWLGHWTQNTFAALSDRDSALALKRSLAHTRILPLDFDRSPESDTGYTGWVQFDDGEIYVVNYILDDAPKGQIRGYSLRREDFLIEPNIQSDCFPDPPIL